VDRISAVGNGRHLRLRLQKQGWGFNGIFFSATAESASVAQGDVVDVAFIPQVNEFRGEKTVQMNIQDVRPHCKAEVSCDVEDYLALQGNRLTPEIAERLLPDRATLGMVWRYLSARNPEARETPECLCRKIVRWAGVPLSLSKLLTCLDIFADVGLLEVQNLHKYISIRLIPTAQKADLNTSRTMQRLLAAKER
jgi:single-stranded-DNA-specific exonuclease